MLKSIITAIKKEMNIYTLIVIFAIPFIVNMIFGYQFKADQIQNVSMAIYDEDNSSLSRMIVNQFIEDEMFEVNYFLDNKEDMQRLFDDSRVKIGLILPKDFGKDVMNAEAPKVLMVYDGSHIPIVSAAKSKASEILATLKIGMSMKVIEAKLNLPHDIAEKTALAVSFKSKYLYNPTKSYRAFLNIGMVMAAVQTGLALIVATAINYGMLTRKKKDRIASFFGKFIFFVLAGWSSFVLELWINWKLFGVPFRGNFEDAVFLSLLLATAVTSFCMMLASFCVMFSVFIRIKQSILLVAVAIVFVPNSIMVGVTYPVIGMPKFYQVIANYYPFYHYSENIREILLKGRGLDTMQGDIIFFQKFIVITLVASLIMLLIPKVKSDSEKEEKEKIEKNMSGKEGDLNVAP